jgi:hypothetical protein
MADVIGQLELEMALLMALTFTARVLGRMG